MIKSISQELLVLGWWYLLYSCPTIRGCQSDHCYSPLTLISWLSDFENLEEFCDQV